MVIGIGNLKIDTLTNLFNAKIAFKVPRDA